MLWEQQGLFRYHRDILPTHAHCPQERAQLSLPDLLTVLGDSMLDQARSHSQRSRDMGVSQFPNTVTLMTRVHQGAMACF